ncbi:hypothetical protein TEA_006813 [Camellia sinensis var. sinensis]|uniref:FBD domain-containing protein n=1 Tax=Camellia sinensis var. sinensis TaxID=542762 RepID=A0A4S4EEG7_CAMSN|nr:hypothetical protein TEA_006813 [Camellia sinensis var. sinensis]
MERNMKEMRGSTSDIISNLPQSVKETILVVCQYRMRESTRKTKTELMRTIYQVLLLHRGPIPKFILNLSRLKSCSEINQLILFLSNNGGVPKRLPNSLNNLKTLKLFFLCFEEVNEISVILCLIRSSPNLEKITVVAPSTETIVVIDPVLELLEIKDWSGVSLNQLQVVQLGGLYGTRSELKFIKLLLAISPVLETMFIQTDSEKVVDEGLRILNEVTQFPRLSPQAEIKFEYKNEDQV